MTRENPMEGLDDLSDFRAQARPPKPAASPEVLNEVAALAGYPSRPVTPVPGPAPTPAPETAPAPAAQAAEAMAPWENTVGVEAVNLLYKMPPDVVVKMNWVIDNVPRMNKQRIVRDAVVAHLDALIQQHYKP